MFIALITYTSDPHEPLVEGPFQTQAEAEAKLAEYDKENETYEFDDSGCGVYARAVELKGL